MARERDRRFCFQASCQTARLFTGVMRHVLSSGILLATSRRSAENCIAVLGEGESSGSYGDGDGRLPALRNLFGDRCSAEPKLSGQETFYPIAELGWGD